MTIDFEKDQQDAMKKTDNIQSLADQVEALEDVTKETRTTRRKFKKAKIRNTRSFW